MNLDPTKNKLIYPELSYQIVGVLFEVHNELGGNLKEKHYQKAVAVKLKERKINFIEQYYIPIKIAGEDVGRYFFDFLIDDKIVLELKVGRFKSTYFKQLLSYIKTGNFKLGIVASFYEDEVRFKRILNLY